VSIRCTSSGLRVRCILFEAHWATWHNVAGYARSTRRDAPYLLLPPTPLVVLGFAAASAAFAARILAQRAFVPSMIRRRPSG